MCVEEEERDERGNQLIKMNFESWFAKNERIQLISSHDDSFVPLSHFNLQDRSYKIALIVIRVSHCFNWNMTRHY